MKKTLGTKISNLRREAGLTQEELAEALGITAQAVSKWENDVTCPDISLLPALAKKLGVTTDYLLSDGDEPPAVRYVAPENRRGAEELMLKMRVTEGESTTVNINIPFQLIKIIIESGGSIDGITGGAVKGSIDFNQIIKMAESGVLGRILEIDSEDAHVEIFVE